MASKRFVGLGTAVWLCAAALGTGCITVGEDFRVEPVSRLEIGTTTRQEVRELFGDPWRVGVEDGDPTWTYAHYRYSAFGAEQTKDLVIRFDAAGRVRSYTFNSTDPADAGRAAP
jgi:outer membrane protein assembly factor BamE (lipoprotein component of BamABCDE complex)